MPESFGTIILIGLGLAIVARFVPRLLSLLSITRRSQREERERRLAREPDLPVARVYHDLLVAEGAPAGIDDRTWRDLDLDDVFCALDSTVSEPGRQYLYRQLRTPRMSAEPLERFERVVGEMSGSLDSVKSLRAALSKLQDPRAARLVNLMFGELPARPKFWLLFPVLTTAAVTCLAVAPFRPAALMWWVGVALTNVVVQVAYKPRVKRFVPAFHEIPRFLRAAQRIGNLPLTEIAPERETLTAGATHLRSLARATRWLTFEPEQTRDEIAAIYEYVNLLFLFDLNAFVFAVDEVRASRDRLRAMFDAMGYLDAAQSVAAWRASLERWCVPQFTEPQKAMAVDVLVHPLLEQPVANSLIIDNTSVLVSGSNMAGKTTFVRALGVNAVLAQTVATVCAASYRAPFLHVRASIGRADSVLEGKSYYLAEVESVLALIRAKRDGAQHLFLLDETFRGTNTTERVAAAYSVLRHLDQGLDLVVVATHDLEVLDLLGDAYAPYHFREQFVDEELTFDFLLQPGRASTRNAIALLRYMKYPEAVVADALAHLDWQGHRRDAGS